MRQFAVAVLSPCGLVFESLSPDMSHHQCDKENCIAGCIVVHLHFTKHYCCAVLHLHLHCCVPIVSGRQYRL